MYSIHSGQRDYVTHLCAFTLYQFLAVKRRKCFWVVISTCSMIIQQVHKKRYTVWGKNLNCIDNVMNMSRFSWFKKWSHSSTKLVKAAIWNWLYVEYTLYYWGGITFIIIMPLGIYIFQMHYTLLWYKYFVSYSI